ncbi:MAG: hypothetical protein K0S35_2262, partial [Geminicoccaceae bacterium]|nr:hypothetical protein [Geminicoccaceae bacterium]
MRATLGDPDGFAMSHSRIGYALALALLGLLGLSS